MQACVLMVIFICSAECILQEDEKGNTCNYIYKIVSDVPGVKYADLVVSGDEHLT